MVRDIGLSWAHAHGKSVGIFQRFNLPELNYFRLERTWANSVSSSGYASRSSSSIKTGTTRIMRLGELP